jgi:hypothetical protein
MAETKTLSFLVEEQAGEWMRVDTSIDAELLESGLKEPIAYPLEHKIAYESLLVADSFFGSGVVRLPDDHKVSIWLNSRRRWRFLDSVCLGQCLDINSLSCLEPTSFELGCIHLFLNDSEIFQISQRVDRILSIGRKAKFTITFTEAVLESKKIVKVVEFQISSIRQTKLPDL